MKKKCYKCKVRLADKEMLGIIYICNDCAHELLKAAILCDYHNSFVKEVKKGKAQTKTSALKERR